MILCLACRAVGTTKVYEIDALSERQAMPVLLTMATRTAVVMRTGYSYRPAACARGGGPRHTGAVAVAAPARVLRRRAARAHQARF